MNNNKGFSSLKIIGLALVVIIIGIVGYFALIRNGEEKLTPPTEPILGGYPIPYIDIEGIVVSVFLDDLHSGSYCKEPEVCPKDRVTIKIDKIDRTSDPYSEVDLNIGDQIEFDLRYSARPAILRWDFVQEYTIIEMPDGDDVIIFRIPDEPATIEGDYILYRLPEWRDGVAEEILPGIEENSRIRFRIWWEYLDYLELRKIGRYEIIS